MYTLIRYQVCTIFFLVDAVILLMLQIKLNTKKLHLKNGFLGAQSIHTIACFLQIHWYDSLQIL